jgi:Pvc16 N-terminal domain
MSSPAAIATVTLSLKSLLAGVVTNEDRITTMSPGVARSEISEEQVNIFLYSTYYNTAFNNAPTPGRTRNGEFGHPPLPLILKYLITAYGRDDNDISGHEVMGQVMQILHDHPVLERSLLESINSDAGLHEQIERIRITPDALSLDDMSKLWTSFPSAEYRLSTGYEVSVVLIESNRASKTPLPVLKRGSRDQGADVVAATSPSLSGLRFPNQKPSVELGDLITLLGEHLSTDNTIVRLQHPRLVDWIDMQPQSAQTNAEMTVQLPEFTDDPELGSKWPAGFYKLCLLIQRPGMPVWKSNSVSLPLSPRIETINPISAPAGNVVLTIECLPQIAEEQRVALLFSDRIIAPDSIATPADPASQTTLTFTVENAIAKEAPYVLRLRVDGVDSIPVDFSGDTPQFADNQKVTIT